jgi:hypothetical protein
MLADVMAGVGLAAAAYEAVAIWFDKLPTITDVTKRFPRLVRAVLLGGAVVWAVDHFEVLP